MSDETKEKLNEAESKRTIVADEAKTNDEVLSSETNEITAEETSENEERESLSPRKKFLVIGGIVLGALLLIVGYLYYERGKTADVNITTTDAAKEEIVVSVKTATATKEPIAREFTAIGNVAPAQASTVAASLSAQIKQMRLLKNQFVRQGEVLAVLASQDLQAQRNEANAALVEAKLNLQTLQKVTIPQTRAQTEKDLADAQAVADNARAVYERRKDLYAKGGLSLKELEASQLVLKNAENALRLAQNNSKLNASAVSPKLSSRPTAVAWRGMACRSAMSAPLSMRLCQALP